jgi:biotin carboxyl carrier protein
MKVIAKNGKHQEEIKIIKREGPILLVAIGNRVYNLDIEKVEHGVYSVIHNGNSHNMEIIKSEKKDFYTVNSQFQTFNIEIAPASAIANGGRKRVNKNERITAPIPGKILSLKVAPGDPVEENQNLVVLSAMKMENELKSPISGIVSKINIEEGDVVKEGTVLVEVKEVG